MGPHEDAARTSADDRLAPDAPAPDDLVSPSRARAVPPGLRIIGGLFGIAMRDSWRSAVDRWRSAVAGISRGSASRADAAAGLARRVERSRDFPLIADYHRRVSEGASSADLIDDRTWDDLDGDDLFAEVDRCASAPGQQVLYAMLRRTDASDADLD